MTKKKICFIAQFPPPIHGLSKAVETLYNSELNKKYNFEKVDITNNKFFLKNIIHIIKSDADLFYFTISQTRGGNLRDLIIFKLLKKKKCLIHLHGGYYRTMVDYELPKWQREANYRAVQKLDGVIVLGTNLKWMFEGMLPVEKFFVVSNCVDDQYLMDDEEFEEKVNTIEQRTIKHVLYLSNFIRSKGYVEILEMAKLEKRRVESGGKRKLHFDFAGKFFENGEKDFFEVYIKSNDLNDYITYHGTVDGKVKKDLLIKCDVFTLLTRYPNEGQPISILEAMGNGMMIVTTNHAGIPDVVEAGTNGIVVDKNNIDILECYHNIIDISDYKMQGIIQKNRNKIKKLYNQSNYIKNMDDVFNTIVGTENMYEYHRD